MADDDAFAPSWEKDDKTTSLLGDSIQTNDETEEIGNLTLGQLRRQREQLEQQIKEKQAMKARKEMEERLMQAKADEKLRRDRRELQEKYEKDKSPNPK